MKKEKLWWKLCRSNKKFCLLYFVLYNVQKVFNFCQVFFFKLFGFISLFNPWVRKVLHSSVWHMTPTTCLLYSLIFLSHRTLKSEKIYDRFLLLSCWNHFSFYIIFIRLHLIQSVLCWVHGKLSSLKPPNLVMQISTL